MNVLFSFKNKKLIVLICLITMLHVCKNLFTLTYLGKMQVLALTVSHD